MEKKQYNSIITAFVAGVKVGDLQDSLVERFETQIPIFIESATRLLTISEPTEVKEHAGQVEAMLIEAQRMVQEKLSSREETIACIKALVFAIRAEKTARVEKLFDPKREPNHNPVIESFIVAVKKDEMQDFVTKQSDEEIEKFVSSTACLLTIFESSDIRKIIDSLFGEMCYILKVWGPDPKDEAAASIGVRDITEDLRNEMIARLSEYFRPKTGECSVCGVWATCRLDVRKKAREEQIVKERAEILASVN